MMFPHVLLLENKFNNSDNTTNYTIYDKEGTDVVLTAIYSTANSLLLVIGIHR